VSEYAHTHACTCPLLMALVMCVSLLPPMAYRHTYSIVCQLRISATCTHAPFHCRRPGGCAYGVERFSVVEHAGLAQHDGLLGELHTDGAREPLSPHGVWKSEPKLCACTRVFGQPRSRNMCECKMHAMALMRGCERSVAPSVYAYDGHTV